MRDSKLGIFIFIGIILVATVGFILIILLFDFGSEKNLQVIENPVKNLNDRKAVELFDEGFVLYLLYSIGAGNLHEPPLSNDLPKIGVYVDEDFYGATVKDGLISVINGDIGEEDIIIRTTAYEIVQMIRDNSYVSESFGGGGSGIELIAGKVKLASKGYYRLYTGLTGEGTE
jgi:hypothetical protein